MLTISPAAADVIRDLTVATPDAAGVRLAAAEGVSPNGTKPSALLRVELADAPAESEQVIEAEDAQVFVEAELASYLDDKVLDVEIDGEQANFVVIEQEEL